MPGATRRRSGPCRCRRRTGSGRPRPRSGPALRVPASPAGRWCCCSRTSGPRAAVGASAGSGWSTSRVAPCSSAASPPRPGSSSGTGCLRTRGGPPRRASIAPPPTPSPRTSADARLFSVLELDSRHRLHAALQDIEALRAGLLERTVYLTAPSPLSPAVRRRRRRPGARSARRCGHGDTGVSDRPRYRTVRPRWCRTRLRYAHYAQLRTTAYCATDALCGMVGGVRGLGLDRWREIHSPYRRGAERLFVVDRFRPA